MVPSSPKGWFLYATYVLESQAAPRSPRYDFAPRGDFRLKSSRETALSIKLFAERASKESNGNGDGYALLVDFYVREASWWSFSEPEQRMLNKTINQFRRELRRAGFPLDRGR